jgi:hypothetical protein
MPIDKQELEVLTAVIMKGIPQWLRHYAANRKVAGSRPDEVNFFNLPKPSGRTRPWGSVSL